MTANDAAPTKAEERRAFVLLAVVLFPVLSVMVVGGDGGEARRMGADDEARDVADALVGEAEEGAAGHSGAGVGGHGGTPQPVGGPLTIWYIQTRKP